jgi:hypothetical protein
MMKAMTDWTARAEKAVNFLAETDRQIAELRQLHERCKRQNKQIWSAIFLRVDGSVEARKAQAETHDEYQSAQAAEMTALKEYEALKNERETACVLIDFWRSYMKAVNEGHV